MNTETVDVFATSAERPSQRPQGTFASVVREIRPHQWSKNTLVVLPLVFAHAWGDADRIIALARAFLAFNAFASAAYVLNDLLDVKADRQHPTKRFRPLASGALSTRGGVFLMVSLLAFGAL